MLLAQLMKEKGLHESLPTHDPTQALALSKAHNHGG